MQLRDAHIARWRPRWLQAARRSPLRRRRTPRWRPEPEHPDAVKPDASVDPKHDDRPTPSAPRCQPGNNAPFWRAVRESAQRGLFSSLPRRRKRAC